MHLYIGYKNYSSWSLRAWLALKVADVPFTETLLTYGHSDALVQLGQQYAIPAQVPVLVDDGLVIWDSLAILEYVAEQYPDRRLWPVETGLRALARSASAEMHSSFMALRSNFPMNVRRELQVTAPVPANVQADLDRLAQIWEKFEQASKPEGDFLCGSFSNVDAMYAPVMWRVRNYGLTVSPAFERWVEAIYHLPAMQTWQAAAQAEQSQWSLPQYEIDV